MMEWILMHWPALTLVLATLSIFASLAWALIGLATTVRRTHGRQEGWGKEE